MTQAPAGSSRPLRIALLTYRGNPRSGGQGVYVHYLSQALAALGHSVTVFSGPPRPELGPGVDLVEVPSLDLYRPEDPFRTPRLGEFKSATDVLEFALMCTAAFPEPLTFTLRAARLLKDRAADFDVVHDNQSLGYGLLAIARRSPLVTTIHHPISIDRRLALSHEASPKRRAALRRWYGFTRMQRRVASRLPLVIVPSQAAMWDATRELSVSPTRTRVVSNGVDTDLFRPLPAIARVPGQILTTTSADVPLKGLVYLIEALAKLRTERDAHLIVVGKPDRRGPVAAAISRFALQDAVTFETDVDRLRQVELYASAQVAVVPSLYEGFSLPAVEAMACETPLVVTDAGALPEVAGPDGETSLHVAPRDAEALKGAIGKLLNDEDLRVKLGTAGRVRVLERFSWNAAAAATVAVYREAIERC